ncbi:MAG: gliding motility-associated C-terminal domain-containing protein [Bacteroidia bacterium]|nr:gliding motility-associated C-terminal domain-containing protein [Bacteroidia bacterium]
MKSLLLYKNILFVFFIICSLSSYAQLHKNNDKYTQANKHVIDITRSEYNALKKQGALSEKQEYRIDRGKAKTFNVSAKNASKSIAAITQCDPLPVQGAIGFSGQVDVDDEYVNIPLQFNFCFYGTNYTSLNLTENGNVQFSTNSTAFSATGFPSTTVNMIAPFWADAESMVQSGGLTYGKIYIDSHPTYMIITWDSMGYFNNKVDKLNSFQLVLTNGLDPILPAGKNVGFYYKNMQWTTGGASGGTNGFPTTQPGTPATIGANQGNGVDYFLIGRFGVPGSVYDGPLGNSDGISWLNGKRFFFDVCPPVGSNQSPASTLIGPCDTVKVCGNDSLIIKNAFIGPELTQTVSVSASAPSLGASFSYTTITNGNNTDINMSVNGSTATNGYHVVTITATDNGTPALTSLQTFIVYVNQSALNNLNGQIVITPTIGLCPGGVASASVNITGGAPNSYLWNDNSAGTSTSFTLTPTLDSTVYVTLKSGQCQKTIKNYIHVKPVPVVSITGNTSLCTGTNSTTVLTASNTLNFNDQAPYTYNWSGTPNPTPINTQTTTATKGTYVVSITNKYNCTSTGVITVNLNNSPAFTVTPSNTVVCVGSSMPLNITLGSFPPSACGLSTSGCSSASTRTVGNGFQVNSNTGSPTPYSNYWRNTHIQILYLASELSAAGVVAGKISSIGFRVNTLNSFNTALPNYTIKMKCTSATNLTTTFDNAGLSQVYQAASYMPTAGVNIHNFNQAYEWDGVSNLLVDICYSRIPSYTSNGAAAVVYATTGNTSVRYENADSQELCGSSGIATTSSNRPNTYFGNCSSASVPSSFSYNWSPSSGLSNPNIINPIATPTVSTIYTVVVTPTLATNCPTTKTVTITINTPTTPTIVPVSALCSNAASFSLSALPIGGTWSVTPSTNALGVFTPSLASIGNNTVTYTYGGVGCSQTTTAIIPVEQFIPSTITGIINPICLPSPSINLATALTTSTVGSGVWSGNGVTGIIFDPTIAGVGTHTLTYSTNSNPTATLCPSSSTISVDVNSTVQPTITAVGPYCSNFSAVNLAAIPSGGTWTGSGITSTGVLTPGSAMIGNNTYTYTVGSAPCSSSQTTTISIELFVPSTITGTINPLCISSAPVNLSTALSTSTLGLGTWSGNGVTGNVFDPAVASTGTHALVYSTSSVPTVTLCPSSSTINISVSAVTQPTLSAAGPYCSNFGVQTMTASPAGGVWSVVTSSATGPPGVIISPTGNFFPSSAIIGNNTLLYTVTSGPCIATQTITVNVVDFISADIVRPLGPYCIYNVPVNLQQIAQNAGGIWSGTGVTGTSFNPSTAGAGTITITYSTDPSPSGLCPDLDSTTIVVNPKPNANAFPDNDGGCNYPWKVVYSTTNVNTGTATWNFGDGSPLVQGFYATHIYNTPGTYTATLYYVDNAGCVDTTSATQAVTIQEVPDASFDPSANITTVIDAEILFTNQTTNLYNNTYEWNFGMLDGSSEINPSFLFANSGEYMVQLIATGPGPYNCKDTAVKKITVNPNVVIYVPNAFTPGNNDGLNDVLQVFLPPNGVDYSTFDLAIYDRWGELIYKTNDVTMSWNGAKNNSGPILKQEVYIWKISFQDINKQYYEKMGHVSLLRK